MAEHTFAAYPTVRKYIADLVDKGMNDTERQQRLAVLEEFCEFVARTPDQMVAEVFDVETQKYRKRTSPRSGHVLHADFRDLERQTARGNIIRSFFIANGRRLPNEKPDWL